MQTTIDKLVSIAFIALLAFIGLASYWDIEAQLLGLAGKNRAADWDQRNTASFPALPSNAEEIRLLPDQMTTWAEDHFGFRYSMVRINKAIYAKVLRDTDSRNELVGTDGWSFLRESNSVLDYVEHRYPMNPVELTQVGEHFESIEQQLNNLGIELLVVLAPNKHSVYAEQLPSYVIRSDETRGDQLTAELSQRGVPFLDLRSILRGKKQLGQLYEKSGSHWTDLGASVAFEAIMLELQDRLPDRETPLLKFEFEDQLQGPFEFSDEKERVPVAVYNAREQVLEAETTYLREMPTEEMTRSEIIRLPNRKRGLGENSLLVFRDSFYTRLEPFFLTQFEDVSSYWQTSFDLEALAENKPDVVIWEFVERHLTQPSRFSGENE